MLEGQAERTTAVEERGSSGPSQDQEPQAGPGHDHEVGCLTGERGESGDDSKQGCGTCESSSRRTIGGGEWCGGAPGVHASELGQSRDVPHDEAQGPQEGQHRQGEDRETTGVCRTTLPRECIGCQVLQESHPKKNRNHVERQNPREHWHHRPSKRLRIEERP